MRIRLSCMSWLVVAMMTLLFLGAAWQVLYTYYIEPAGRAVGSAKRSVDEVARKMDDQSVLDGKWQVIVQGKPTSSVLVFSKQGWTVYVDGVGDNEAWDTLKTARNSLALRPDGIPATRGPAQFELVGDRLLLVGGRYGPLNEATIFSDDSHPSAPALWDYESNWKMLKKDADTWSLTFIDAAGYTDKVMIEEGILTKLAAPKEPGSDFAVELKRLSQ